MYGVVLWSDPVSGSAVIWCDDRGNLAYFDSPRAKAEPNPVLDAGDLVEFDAIFQQDRLVARNANPVRVALPDTVMPRRKVAGAFDPAPCEIANPHAAPVIDLGTRRTISPDMSADVSQSV